MDSPILCPKDSNLEPGNFVCNTCHKKPFNSSYTRLSLCEKCSEALIRRLHKQEKRLKEEAESMFNDTSGTKNFYVEVEQIMNEQEA